ncbi:AMP-binding protein [Prauserella endophytica]|uniref:Acyl-CoA synthetase n=1 Tax=Prauserella endophytica TaxID=1592324 RepID=A0ABY2S573_9PSEU|nr:AMP-binding protein [Prauserella endophytica]PXY30016.1 acetate--CoA ligase [Prauserella coralliicola]TKG71077.1 acyl-CoA synthetase [Prauserella endophytica]
MTGSVWDEIEAGLSTAPNRLNTAQEACGRYTGQRGRLALVVRHADGSGERWTYRELYRAASRAARAFARAGLRPGDRVAGLLSRQVESLVVALAAWRSGLVYVPLFCGFGTDALAFRLRSSRAGLIVCDHRWRDVLDAALSTMDGDPGVMVVTGPRGTGVRRGDYSFWAEVERSAPDGPESPTSATDPATLLFTSGTTGDPKSCVMPHGALLSVLPFARHSLGAGPGDLLFTTADPGWAYGLYSTGVAPMALGAPRVVYSGDYDAAAWLRVMREEGVTCVAAAPSAYRKLLPALRRYGVPGELSAAAAAGEPLDADTASRWTGGGAPPIRDGYGLSEVGMVLADLADGAKPEPGTLGGPIPGFAVRLVDRDGEPVAEGESGLIAVERPRYQLSTGYENRPEAWEARWQGDLFVTEDRARTRPDGRWVFLGREDDMIVTSGYNVSPVDVERVLNELPGVAEAAAVAAPGPGGGTVVRAVVVRAPSAPPSAELEQRLRAEVTSRIGAHASPRVIDYADALPRNEVGKLQRARLR